MVAATFFGGTTLVVLPGAPCPADKVIELVRSQGSDLPRDLISLEQYPMATRKAILAVLPKEDLLRMWQEHLSRFERDPRLDTLQRVALANINRDLASFVDPASLRDRAAFESRVKATFGRLLCLCCI
jgi:hypothetical protein